MKIRYVLALCALMLGYSAVAQAAEEIVIVDMKRIIQDSVAAKTVREKIRQQRDTYQTEITKQEEDLRKAEKALGEQRNILSPEAFENKRKQFKDRLQNVQKDVQEKREKLDASFNQALDQIQTAVLDIINTLAQEKQFKVAIPSSQVLFAANNLDITQDVLTALNQKLPVITLTDTAAPTQKAAKAKSTTKKDK